jgi:hypothetical protein
MTEFVGMCALSHLPSTHKTSHPVRFLGMILRDWDIFGYTVNYRAAIAARHLILVRR